MKKRTGPRIHLICDQCYHSAIGTPYPHKHADEKKCCWCGRKADDPKFRLDPAVLTVAVGRASA